MEKNHYNKVVKQKKAVIKMSYPTYQSKEDKDFDESKVMKRQIISLADGREVKAELWSEVGYTFLSYYISIIDLESYDKEELIEYLEEQGIKNLSTSDKFSFDDISISRQQDKAENEFWVLTINFGET